MNRRASTARLALAEGSATLHLPLAGWGWWHRISLAQGAGKAEGSGQCAWLPLPSMMQLVFEHGTTISVPTYRTCTNASTAENGPEPLMRRGQIGTNRRRRRVELVMLHADGAQPQETAAWLGRRPQVQRHHHIRLSSGKVSSSGRVCTAAQLAHYETLPPPSDGSLHAVPHPHLKVPEDRHTLAPGRSGPASRGAPEAA